MGPTGLLLFGNYGLAFCILNLSVVSILFVIMSKKPLLRAEGDDITNYAKDDSSILDNSDHSFVRLSFLVLSQLLLFVLGGGFYTFPMWLNFILPDYMSLSRSELTVSYCVSLNFSLILWFYSY